MIPKTLLLIFLLLSTIGLSSAGDSAEINQMFANATPGETIHLQARVYVIDETLNLCSDITLEGEAGTVFQIPAHCKWVAWKPAVSGIKVKNVVIKNIVFDGQVDEQDVSRGEGYHNFIHVIDCDNIQVHDCTFRNSKGDGFRVKTSTNCKFYNCVAYNLGHDCFYAIDSTGIEAFGNTLTTHTNSALRVWNSAHVRFYDNTLNGVPETSMGMAGVQLEDSKGVVVDVEICNNTFFETWGPAVWLIAYDKGKDIEHDISIHDNLFKDVAQSTNIPYTAAVSNVGMAGVSIEKNVFDGARSSAYKDQARADNVVIQDNTITNTKVHPGKEVEGSGYGIAITADSNVTITNNDCYANEKGNVYGVTAPDNNYADPKTNGTSSGWSWNGDTWYSAGVQPKPLHSTSPTASENTTDQDTHEPQDFLLAVLETVYDTSGINQQNLDTIEFTKPYENQGSIYGNLEAVGYYNQIYIDDSPYTSQKEDVAVKIDLVQTPELMPWNSAVDRVEKNMTIDVAGKITTVTLDVVKYWHDSKLVNDKVIRAKRVNHVDYATFNDTIDTVPVLDRPNNTTPAYIKVVEGKAPFFKISYDDYNTSKVTIRYNGSEIEHYRLLGEKQTLKNGLTYTNFTRVNFWNGDLGEIGPKYLQIREVFDPNLLEIYVETPYEKYRVEVFVISYSDWDGRIFAWWMPPFIVLMAIFLIDIYKHYKIWKRLMTRRNP